MESEETLLEKLLRAKNPKRVLEQNPGPVTVPKKEGAAHARLSPSSAERWMTCPGAPRMEDQSPEEETSVYSKEGTAAHTVRELCLVTGLDVDVFVGRQVEAGGIMFEVTREWADWLQPGIDRIREFKGEWVFEYRVDMEPWIPGGFGTLDAGGISDTLIIIDDLKFGKGIRVDAKGLKQLMIYALGFWMNYARHKTKATQFLLRVDQPRIPGSGSEWSVSLDELLVFAEEVAAAALATLDPESPLVPSEEACRFCRAAANAACYALDQFVLELIGLTLEDLDKPRKQVPEMIEYEKMEPERRSYVIQHTALIRKWLDNLRSSALADALSGVGDPVPGFKAVATQGGRSWRDPKEAEDFFKGRVPQKDLYNQAMKSPAQLEKQVGTRIWARAQELIHRPEGKPALVPESDPRPALIPLLELLDDLEEEDRTEDLLGDLDDLLGESGEEGLDDDFDDLI